MLFPLVSYHPIDLAVANRCLVAWGHKMGPLLRPNFSAEWHHGLFHAGEIVGVTCTSSLIRETVAGGAMFGLGRHNTCELSRLCSGRPHLNRALLRMWREFVFVDLPYDFAISYQDADLHTGNTYRNDGWYRLAYSHSGMDRRSGLKGRNKYVWLWSKAGGRRELQAIANRTGLTSDLTGHSSGSN